MDRRTFLRNCSLLAAGTVAADQLDLVERIKARTRYVFGPRIERFQSPGSITIYLRSGAQLIPYRMRAAPAVNGSADASVAVDRAGILEPYADVVLPDFGRQRLSLNYNTRFAHAGHRVSTRISLTS